MFHSLRNHVNFSLVILSNYVGSLTCNRFLLLNISLIEDLTFTDFCTGNSKYCIIVYGFSRIVESESSIKLSTKSLRNWNDCWWKMEGFNILEQCKKIRRIQSSPYSCPIPECGKVYIGFCGLQYHLVHVEHPLAELKAYFDKLPDVPVTTPARHHHHNSMYCFATVSS